VAPTPTPESPEEVLIRGLEELELEPTRREIEDLIQYTGLLDEWSSRMNLTAHRTRDGVVRRLLLDAAALGANFGPVASLADVGSGAGLPGIPLAILWRDCRVSLIEPRKKRYHFLRAVVRELGLTNVTLRFGRSEDLETEPHSAVVAQALAPPGQALEWMLPWVEVGGVVVLPGSSQAAAVPQHAGVVGVGEVGYRVPCGGAERSLWIGRRVA
jgi:16S rRNA (guanine527-N7)-methyltransferase